MKFFNPSEFDCPCCGANRMQDVFLEVIDAARKIAGISFNISSGFRCKARNLAIGGADGSSHCAGWAADIVCHDDRARYQIVTALIRAGVDRIGVYDGHIHADCDPVKPGQVIWVGISH